MTKRYAVTYRWGWGEDEIETRQYFTEDWTIVQMAEYVQKFCDKNPGQWVQRITKVPDRIEN